MVKGIINILHIQRPNLPAVLLNRTLHGIGPGSHIVHIRLGYRQPSHHSAHGKIQLILGKALSGA